LFQESSTLSVMLRASCSDIVCCAAAGSVSAIASKLIVVNRRNIVTSSGRTGRAGLRRM
jgi:hypothetical protein